MAVVSLKLLSEINRQVMAEGLAKYREEHARRMRSDPAYRERVKKRECEWGKIFRPPAQAAQ